MAIERLQQSHREAMLRDIATGELNPLEPWDTRFSDVSKNGKQAESGPERVGFCRGAILFSAT